MNLYLRKISGSKETHFRYHILYHIFSVYAFTVRSYKKSITDIDY